MGIRIEFRSLLLFLKERLDDEFGLPAKKVLTLRKKQENKTILFIVRYVEEYFWHLYM